MKKKMIVNFVTMSFIMKSNLLKRVPKLVVILIFTIMSWNIVLAISDYSNFYAYYTKINVDEYFEKYSRTSEHADIVVHPGEVGQLIFG